MKTKLRLMILLPLIICATAKAETGEILSDSNLATPKEHYMHFLNGQLKKNLTCKHIDINFDKEPDQTVISLKLQAKLANVSLAGHDRPTLVSPTVDRELCDLVTEVIEENPSKVLFSFILMKIDDRLEETVKIHFSNGLELNSVIKSPLFN